MPNNRQEIFKTTVKVLSVVLKIKSSDIGLNSRLEDDFGADSVEIIEIFTRLCDAFHLELTQVETSEIRTVSDIVDYLEKRVNSA